MNKRASSHLRRAAATLALLTATASWAQDELRHAARDGQQAEVERLLDAGADVNARDGSGFTALHLAAHNHRTEVAEVLLQRGADLDAHSAHG